MSIPLNFTMHSGDSNKIVLTCTDENGDAYDLTGVTVSWVLKSDVFATSALVTKTTADPAQVSILDNVITVWLSPSDTATLYGNYYHECEMVEDDSWETTLVTGVVTVEASGV